ncbi:membrane protein insertase YidC [Alphaproteobacteria bacterium]|nr:membrane protein insertase YidC [Alphaproteobacteria bacterium]
MDNQKNLILAVTFSILVLIVFDFFVNKPIREQAMTDTLNTENIDEGLDPKISNPQFSIEKNENVKENRVSFDLKRIQGSINLYGATFDDIILKDYRMKVEKNSEPVRVLFKENSEAPFLVRNGWASTTKIDLPNKNTLWKIKEVESANKGLIELFWKNNQEITFQRKIVFDENYLIKITDSVTNLSEDIVNLSNYSYIQRKNHRPENKFFILHEGPIGVFNQELRELSYDEIEEKKVITENASTGWIGITDHYWQVSIFPEAGNKFESNFKNIKNQKNSIQVDFINKEIFSLKPSETISTNSFIFVGAKEVPLIDSYMKKYNIQNFDLSVDFGWFYFLTKPLFYALNYLSLFFGNFGIGIIILTLFVRVLLFPLANKSFKSMNAMKLLTPEIQRLKERFKDDKTKMNQEMFNLYKQKKINPAAGCLPILLQIPIFFALYKVLFVSIEMRHAPFFGWIKDLSAPDPTSIFNVFGLIPWDPPGFLIIGIWPILMGLTMYLQQKLNPPPPDPIQAKIFMMLPFIFTFLLATFPAGMVIYWTFNNILSIAQQSLILRKQKLADS